jgi:hypothetical protein
MLGMGGAVAGGGLHLAGVVGDTWPVVAIGLYGVGVLLGPADPVPGEPGLTDTLRDEVGGLLSRAKRRSDELPAGCYPAVAAVLEVLRLVLDRLDQVADQPLDRAAAPERLATAAVIIRSDLPTCLDTYLGRAATTPADQAAAELVEQLSLVAGAADRLAAAVPDVHARRAEELTEELRRRYGA